MSCHFPYINLVYNVLYMNNQKYPFQQLIFRILTILLIVSILASCQIFPTSATPTTEVETVAAPSLPPTFQTSLTNPFDTPRTYIDDACRYLRNKWNPSNAEPGTVVMVILIRNITPGTAELPNSVSVGEFTKLMEQLKEQGFEAINTKQLQAFMERNITIPTRSVYIIQYGNHDAEYFERYFREYYEDWGWPVVNGWVSDPTLTTPFVEGNLNLEREGFVDHQAQGVLSDTTLSDDSAKTVIARELQGSINGLSENFAKNPVAIIWPNGGFGMRPIEAARQLRFKLGFTTNARGPIFYNWVPLANEVDSQRPAFTPEGNINDPLMTLPTFSPQEAIFALDFVRIIGKEAAAYALENKQLEHEYYEIVCSSEYGPMPTP
jgi:hypothetical protein